MTSLTFPGNVYFTGTVTSPLFVSNQQVLAPFAAGTASTLTVQQIGIKQSFPAYDLDVNGSARVAGTCTTLQTSLINGNTNVGSLSTALNQLTFSYGVGSYTHAVKSRHDAGGSINNALDFWLWNYGIDAVNASPSKAVMTIAGTGAVGINNFAPSFSLDVSGSTRTNYETVNLYSDSIWNSVRGYFTYDSTLLDSTGRYTLVSSAGIAYNGIGKYGPSFSVTNPAAGGTGSTAVSYANYAYGGATFAVSTGVSVSCWVKLNNLPTSGNRYFPWTINNGFADTNGLFLTYNTANGGNTGFIANYQTTSASFASTSNSTAVSTGLWYHTCITLGSNTLTLYINGVSVGSVATTGTTNLMGLAVGYNARLGGEGLSGEIDDLRVFNRVLSTGEITTISSATSLTTYSVTNAITAATVSALTVNSLNQVGVNTSSPAAALDVTGSVRATGSVTSNQLVVNGSYNNIGTYLKILGDVGTNLVVNGADPSYDQSAQLSISTGSNTGPGASIGLLRIGVVGSCTAGGILGAAFLQGVNSFTAKTPILLNPSGGAIGIGTPSPSTSFYLDVGNTTTANTNARFGPVSSLYFINTFPTIGYNTFFSGGYQFGSNTSASYAGFSQLDNTLGKYYIAISNGTGTLSQTPVFGTTLTLTNTSVGINTTSPSNTLDISGSFRLTNGTTFQPTTAIINANGASAGVYFSTRGGVTAGTMYAGNITGLDGVDTTYGALSLSVNTGNWSSATTTYQECIRLRGSNGFVGINQASPTYQLDVGGTARVSNGLTVNTTYGTYGASFAVNSSTTASGPVATFYSPLSVGAISQKFHGTSGSGVYNFGILQFNNIGGTGSNTNTYSFGLYGGGTLTSGLNGIGINTNSPTAALHTTSTINTYTGTTDFTNVTGNALTLQDTASYPRVIHKSTDASVSVVNNYQTGKNVYWGESTDTGAYVFRGRSVGIGNTLPSYPLDVTGISRLNGAIMSGTVNLNKNTLLISTTGDNGHGLLFNSTVDGPILAGFTGGQLCYGGISGSAALSWTSTGVGIKTSSPSFPLDVTGNARFTGTITAAAVTNTPMFTQSFNVGWSNQTAPATKTVTFAAITTHCYHLICAGFDDGGNVVDIAGGFGQWLVTVTSNTNSYGITPMTSTTSADITVTMTAYNIFSVQLNVNTGNFIRNYHFKLLDLGAF